MEINNLQFFKNEELGEIRTVDVGGEVYFIGKDIAIALGYTKYRNALSRHVDEEDKIYINLNQFYMNEENNTFDKPPRNRAVDKENGDVNTFSNNDTIIINESGLYSLILSSKLSNAKKFKRWVTSEVLPAIRATGGYIGGAETLSEKELLSKALEIAYKTIGKKEEESNRLLIQNSRLMVENQRMQPKAEYFDELVDRNLLLSFRDTAKLLNIKCKKFIDFLIDKKYIYRDKGGKLAPYSKYKDDGLFEMREAFNEKTSWAGTQTLTTPKGRETFRILLLKEDI